MSNTTVDVSLIKRLSDALQSVHLKEFTERFLPIVGEALKAEGCSLLLVAPQVISVRWGKIPEEALELIERWEKKIKERLKGGVWTAQWVESPPINEISLPRCNGRIFNTPLALRKQIVGSLTLVMDSQALLTPEKSEIFTSFVKWFTNALALYSQMEIAYQRLRNLELFFQIGQHMISTFDLNKLLMDTMEVASLILDAMAASLMLIKEETKELVLEIVYGAEGETVRTVRSKVGEGIAGWVASHGKPLIVNDVHKDPRFNPRVDTRTGVLTRSIICVPLQIKGKTIGILEVINKRSGNGFDEEDLKLLSTIAAQAAVAIENAKLYQSLKEEKDRILQVQEETRRELARNLHDSTVQFLSAISMGLDHLERLLEVKPEAVKAELEALRQMTKQAIKETRLLLFELRPLILESQGLVPALRSYVEQLNNTESFFTRLEVKGLDRPIRLDVARTLFSIIQEAINNVRKHARAKNVTIKLSSEGDFAVTKIIDDGVGFNVREVLSKYEERGSLGLINMQERAKLIGAQLIIQSNDQGPKTGTVVTIRIPKSRAFESRQQG